MSVTSYDYLCAMLSHIGISYTEVDRRDSQEVEPHKYIDLEGIRLYFDIQGCFLGQFNTHTQVYKEKNCE